MLRNRPTFLVALGCLYVLDCGAYGQEAKKAEDRREVLPCTCPFWVIGEVGGGAKMYYATYYPEGSNCENGEPVYYIGDEAIPQICEDCVPERVGVEVRGGISHHTAEEFTGLEPPRGPDYSILNDIRPTLVRNSTHVIQRLPRFYKFAVDGVQKRIKAYRFVLAVDPSGINRPDVPPAMFNVAIEVTAFSNNDPPPVNIDATPQKLRGNHAFQLKYKIGQQEVTDVLLLDKLE